jgi:hypothetical protein
MRTQKCVQRKQKRDQNTLDEAAFVRDLKNTGREMGRMRPISEVAAPTPFLRADL